MSDSIQRSNQFDDINPQSYLKSRLKGIAVIGIGLVGGWFAGLAVNKMYRQGRGISAERIEQFGGPFKKYLKGLQHDDVLLYETVGSVLGGAGAAIYRGYGGWKRSREQSADLKEIKERVQANYSLLSSDVPVNTISETQSRELLTQEVEAQKSV